jgi:Sec-independent protein translocase protein TatA
LVILIVALLFLGPDKLPDAAKKISQGIRDIKKQSRALQRTIEDDEHIGGAIRDLKSALRGEEEPIRARPIKPPKQLEPAEAASIPALPEANPSLLEHGATATASEQAGELVAVAAAPTAGVTLAALSLHAGHAGDSGASSAGTGGLNSSNEETFRGVLAPTPTSSTAATSPSRPAIELPAATERERDLGPAEPTLRGVVVPKPSTSSGQPGKLTMPPTAGEPDDAVPGSAPADDAELAALVKPAPHTIARSSGSSISAPAPAAAPAADPADKLETKHG